MRKEARTLNTIGVIEAGRDDRDPEAAVRIARLASRRLGGKPLLEWLVRRVSEADHLQAVVVLLGDSAHDQQLSTLVPSDVPVVHCAQPSTAARLVTVLQHHPAEAVVRVRVRDPFVDPHLIDTLIDTARRHPGCDYIGYRFPNGEPAMLSKVGMFAEWCHTDTLKKLLNNRSMPPCRGELTHYFETHPDAYRLRWVPIPAQLNRHDMRLSIGGQDDWDHAEQILDALGPDDLHWRRIAGLLHHQPRLRERMARLNQADAA